MKKNLKVVESSFLFNKPISFLFAFLSIIPPIYFLIRFIEEVTTAFNGNFFKYLAKREGKLEEIAAAAAEGMKKAAEQPDADKAQLAFQVETRSGMIAACVLILVVLFVLAVIGILIWKREKEDLGNKIYPNIYGFVKNFGIWVGLYVGISAFFVALFLRAFEGPGFFPGAILAMLGRSSVTKITWALAIKGLLRGVLIIVATRIALWLLDIRWSLWKALQAVRQFFAGFGASAEQKSHVALGFVAILAVIAGFSLMYIGVTSKPPVPVKKIVSEITIKNISGGDLPDALTGTAAEIKLGDASKTPQPDPRAFENDLSEFGNDPFGGNAPDFSGLNGADSNNDLGNPQAPEEDAKELAVTETGLSSKTAVYGGLLTLLLGVIILGYLTLRKRQQQ
jgi:hypothetical protein